MWRSFSTAPDLETQRAIYLSRIKPRLWGPTVRWMTRQDLFLTLLGVPRSQRRQIDRRYRGGISQYVEDQVDELCTQVPVGDNYFWRVYATGQYTPECCPGYLQEDNFLALKAGLVDRISVHTTTVLDFLQSTPHRVSCFVLLDHMDWLYEQHQGVLLRQWQAVVDRAAVGRESSGVAPHWKSISSIH